MECAMVLQWRNGTCLSGRRGNFYQVPQDQHPSYRQLHVLFARFRLLRASAVQKVQGRQGLQQYFRSTILKLLKSRWATPKRDVEITFQEIDSASHLFYVRSADLLKSYSTCTAVHVEYQVETPFINFPMSTAKKKGSVCTHMGPGSGNFQSKQEFQSNSTGTKIIRKLQSKKPMCYVFTLPEFFF